MDKIFGIIAACTAFNSLMMLLMSYPGGTLGLIIAYIRKIEFGVWVFIVADITALSTSVAVLVVALTVGPTEKNKKRVRIAMLTATVAMAIALRHIVRVRPELHDSGLWFVVNGSTIYSMISVCFLIYIVCSNSPNNQVEAGPVVANVE